MPPPPFDKFHGKGISMQFKLHRPNSIEEAVALYRETGGTYLAGGTVLLVNRHSGADIGRHLISLESIAPLRGIRETAEGIAIGPCQVSLMGEDDLFVTVPFQCTAKAEKLFQSEKVEFVSLSDYLACIGISGPESRKTLVTCGVKEEDLPEKGETKLLELDGLRAIVSFSQHFDDEGFEINFNAECADQIWDLLLETDRP